MRISLLCLGTAVLTAAAAGPIVAAEPPVPAGAAAAIEKLGGKVEIDKTAPGKPIVAVNWLFAKVGNDDLALLKGLTALRSLDLGRTRVTDPGLANLEGLKRLQSLNLAGTKVTSGGLSHIKGLTELRYLNVGKLIADPGMENLEGLTNMERLDISGNKITDAGLAYLRGMKKLLRAGSLQHLDHRRGTGETQEIAGAHAALPLQDGHHGQGAQSHCGDAATGMAGSLRHEDHRQRRVPPATSAPQTQDQQVN